MKEPDRKGRLTAALVAPTLLVVLSVVVAIVFAIVSANRQLTALEGSLLQGFSLLAGLAGSFVFGKLSAVASARDLIRPHARSAFRRVLSLYQGLGRLAEQIDRAKGAGKPESEFTAYDVLQAIVAQQIFTVDDALEDWRDIVPEEVAELESRVRRGQPLMRSDR